MMSNRWELGEKELEEVLDDDVKVIKSIFGFSE